MQADVCTKGTSACFREPERFGPTGTDTYYQAVVPSYWSAWGGGDDLHMGQDGPPGTNGHCDQGSTYAGSPNQICGGEYNWGETQLEVWRLATPGKEDELAAAAARMKTGNHDAAAPTV